MGPVLPMSAVPFVRLLFSPLLPAALSQEGSGFQPCHQSPFLSHRWLCYCHVPQSCDSLPRYETTHVFGRSLLKSIFTVTRRQLLEKFRVEKDKLVPEKRTLILTHFPK